MTNRNMYITDKQLNGTHTTKWQYKKTQKQCTTNNKQKQTHTQAKINTQKHQKRHDKQNRNGINTKQGDTITSTPT